ncbi:MAG: D-glycero-beta-D-manno-heptose 1-phosphate adenylyltransferase [Bacteriovoracaceae bacterium]|jgi:rfaE bifunctional protein nucleotidyltransferase chain/domain|nr:D-glycero-beta-D-manno-heptose 1-phosphate adenylyltransferase [Bacteriovoracaceae bacterium]
MSFSENLKNFIKENKDKTIVFTNGCFDILHRGHVAYLNEAKSLGQALVVGLNSDASVKRLKGETRPINSELDRKFVLENLSSVDFVEIFEDDTPLSLIKEVTPNILVKGGDWEIDQIVGADFVLENNGQVFSLNFVDGYSTTNIIEKSKLHS